ncbi:MAG: tRNA pseudouridine(38-40) synthase TruA [Lachnospiraceae bacterium]|nr:tRNA pseudouridine(38-40) synthase TruA [Lachnospiraceae bacterium]
MRVKLVVAYDGTSYCGWQVQPNGVSVQQVLNETLSELFGQEIAVVGASRTDAGVHALGNVCAFDVDTRMPGEKIAYALNQRLPDDIVIQESAEASSDFHPRFSKNDKTYEYRILNRRFALPTIRNTTYFFHHKLDVERMQKAADYLVGEHDFTSFASIHSQTNTFVRTIYEISVTRDSDDIVTIRVRGNGFLYNMVRIIAGTLIQIGTGLKEVEDMPRILEGKNRELAGPTAPPEGLTLIHISYDN